MRQADFFHQLEQRIDDLRQELLGGFGEPAGGVPLLTSGTRLASMPAVDVVDEGNQFVVTAEVPGYDRRDIKLEVDEQGLLIRASRTSSEERRSPRGEQRWIRRERSAQAFERYIPLPDEVSADGVRATFRNGVLEVSVPKTSPEKRRRRSIEID